MERIKLVQIVNGEIVTGEALKAILIAEGFTVPVMEVVPLYYKIKPPYPTVPKPHNEGIWITYFAECAEARAICDNAFSIRTAQVNAFEQVITEMFVLATGTYDRPIGTWNYSIVPTPYTFKMAAQKLTGTYAVRPLDPIDFICNGYF